MTVRGANGRGPLEPDDDTDPGTPGAIDRDRIVTVPGRPTIDLITPTPPPADGTPPSFRFFRVREFDCRDQSPYPPAWVPLRLTKLVGMLDELRAKWGGPLTVVSGYRTIAYNAKIGGAGKSQHCEGRAADIRPNASSSQSGPQRVRALHAMVLRMWDAGELPDLGALGLYPGWIHCDVRDRQPIGHLAQWVGTGVGSERVT